MAKIIIYLGKQERTAIQQLVRVPRAQAAPIIREELARQVMLPERTKTQDQSLESGVQS